MTIPERRHRLVSDWESHAGEVEPAFREPDIVDHLERMAFIPGSFESILSNIAKDLQAQPWLVEEADYEWALDRTAYRFAQEALNQSRVLNALGGLVRPQDPKALASGIAARQYLRWRIEDAEPHFARHADWRFVVLPFGWDNAISLLMLAFQAHAGASPIFQRMFPGSSPLADWRRPAKGLLLAGMPLPAQLPVVDSFLLEAMRNEHPWYNDALISIAEFDDPAVRTIWSLSSDWVVGHEVTHALLHETVPWSIEREMEADLGGLIQLITWTRPRDLTGLAEDLSPNFWDFISARTGLMMLTLASNLAQRQRGPAAVTMTDGAMARLVHLHNFIDVNLGATTITSEEVGLITQFADRFDAFMADFSALQVSIPPWAPAQSRRAARQADRVFHEELAAHKAKGGGLILPEN
jgi:hypothetical protein